MLSFRASPRADTRAVEWDGRAVGLVRVADAAAGVEVSHELPRAGMAALIETLRAEGVRVLGSRSLPLRFEARQQGFCGGLRADLRLTADAPADFLDALQGFLPELVVEEAPHRSVLRRAVASALSGVSGMTRLRIRHTKGGDPLTVVFPKRDDNLAEAIACVVDTTFAVRARFGDAVHLDTISFDYSSAELSGGKHAGEAPRLLGEVHLNAAYATAEGYEQMGKLGRSGGSPFRLPKPWTHLDATIAHEVWHKIEVAWETEQWSRSVDFRREVGGLFGCETLEKVFSDSDALAGLAEGVSNYATTNRLEATAEMFEQWWCGPAPVDSIAARFGEIVQRYF